jgi:hypothetical protein
MSKAATILAYKRYLDIFPVNPVEAKTLLRKLQKEWHPDKNHDPQAHNVFIHIMQLYELGPSNIKYIGPSYIRHDGAERKFKAVTSINLSFCTVYYSDKSAVLLEFTEASKFLINHFRENIKTVRSNTPGHLKDKYDFLYPQIHEVKNDNILIIQLPFFVPLPFVQKYIDQHEDYRLAFWIVSRAFDINMLFDACGLVSNGCIAPLCFVDMKGHRLLDLSAYLFAAKDKLHALDTSQIQFYSPVSLMNKVPDKASAVALIKAFGLKLIGDKTGTGVNFKKDKVPDAMISFLASASFTNILDSYKTWQSQISKKSFGQIKFHDLVLSFSQLFEYFNGD